MKPMLVGGLVGRAVNKYLRINSAYMPVAASAIKKKTYIHVKAQASIVKKMESPNKVCNRQLR